MTDAWGGPPPGGDWQGGARPSPPGYWPQPSSGHAPAPIRVPLFEQAVPNGYPRSAAPTAPSLPEQRSDGAVTDATTGGRAQRRRGTAAGPQERRRSGAVSASVLVVVPLVAALASGGRGLVFDVGAVLAAVLAAALCSRPGVWWVFTGAPPVVLLMALAGFVVHDSSATTGKFATHMATCVAGAFPAMAAAMAAAVVVGLVRLLAARRGR